VHERSTIASLETMAPKGERAKPRPTTFNGESEVTKEVLANMVKHCLVADSSVHAPSRGLLVFLNVHRLDPQAHGDTVVALHS
jgi:hypothetical protein